MRRRTLLRRHFHHQRTAWREWTRAGSLFTPVASRDGLKRWAIFHQQCRVSARAAPRTFVWQCGSSRWVDGFEGATAADGTAALLPGKRAPDRIGSTMDSSFLTAGTDTVAADCRHSLACWMAGFSCMKSASFCSCCGFHSSSAERPTDDVERPRFNERCSARCCRACNRKASLHG